MLKKVVLSLLVTLTTLFAYTAPMSVPGSTYITTEQAYELYKKKTKFLDVRPEKFIKQGKIHGAAEFYVGLITPKSVFLIGRKSEPIIVYCNGVNCPLTQEAIQKLVSYGYNNLYYYRDGFPAWKAANFPTE